jgi:hypothetical protein
MPEGLVRTDLNTTGTSFKKGVPVQLPLDFGTDVTTPHSFGNPVPATDPTFVSNPVTLPKNFGNIIT